MQQDLSFLHTEFEKRKAKNGRYSLRAFARQMGVHPSTLSSVLSGKRPLSLKDAYTLSEKLGMDSESKKMLFNSLFVKKQRPLRLHETDLFGSTDALQEEDAFDVIAEWEHYALFLLLETEDFRLDFEWISKRLGISVTRVQYVFQKLIQTKLIELNSDFSVKKRKSTLTTSDEKMSIALRKSHKDSLRAAEEALSIPIEMRDFTSSIFCVDKKSLAAIKKEIRRFHARVYNLASKNRKKEVYEILVSFYPKTKVGNFKL